MYPGASSFSSETNDYGGNYGQDLWTSTDDYAGLGGVGSSVSSVAGMAGLSSSSSPLNGGMSGGMNGHGGMHGGGMNTNGGGYMHGGGMNMHGMSQYSLDQARLDAFDSLEMNPMVTDANLYIKVG